MKEEITYKQIRYIETLLLNNCLEETYESYIYKNLDNFDAIEADYYITMLQNNQLDPITQGYNYSQTDIINKLNTL